MESFPRTKKNDVLPSIRHLGFLRQKQTPHIFTRAQPFCSGAAALMTLESATLTVPFAMQMFPQSRAGE